VGYTFNDSQIADLKRVWQRLGGLERLADSFTDELAYFMEHCPELITEGNRKIETKESRDYSTVAKHCDKLLQALEEIPALDRLNRLSMRAGGPLSGPLPGFPLCDPIEYVQAIKKLATQESSIIKRYAKYERQLTSLRSFVNRFPPLREISRSNFLDLAALLWPDASPDSLERAYRPEQVDP